MLGWGRIKRKGVDVCESRRWNGETEVRGCACECMYTS
jgi:hypothetical protein